MYNCSRHQCRSLHSGTGCWHTHRYLTEWMITYNNGLGNGLKTDKYYTISLSNYESEFICWCMCYQYSNRRGYVLTRYIENCVIITCRVIWMVFMCVDIYKHFTSKHSSAACNGNYWYGEMYIYIYIFYWRLPLLSYFSHREQARYGV